MTSKIRLALILLIAVCSFALSFHALSDLAVAARIPVHLSWALPIVVDGTAVVAALTAQQLSRAKSRAVRSYPWIVVVMMGLFSCAANAVHAVGGTIPPSLAAGIGSIPAISLAAAVHLAIESLRVGTSRPAARAVTPARIRAVSAPAAVKPRTVSGSKQAGVDAVLAYVAEHNTWPSGRTVGDLLNVSRKTGSRYVAAAREAAQG